MLKLLVVSPTSGNAGIDQTLVMLLVGLSKKGHEISLVIPKDPIFKETYIKNNINLIETDLLRWYFPIGFKDSDLKENIELSESSIRYITRICSRIKPDIIFGNTSVSLDSNIVAATMGIPHISHLHATFVDNIYLNMTDNIKSKIYSFFLRENSYIITPSKQTIIDIQKEIGSTKFNDNFMCIPNGVDIDKYSPINKNSSSEIINILSLGHYNDNKNQKILIQVASILKNNAIDNFKFTLVGYKEEEYFEEIRLKIKTLKLEKYFSLLNVQKNVLPYLYDADIYVNSSKTETFPVSVLEAMSTGLPVVCTKTGSVEIIDHQINGFIAKDELEISEYLIKLIKNEELRKEIGIKARAKIVSSFSHIDYVNRFENKIIDICKNKNNYEYKDQYFNLIYKNFQNKDYNSNLCITVIIPDKTQTSYELLIRKPFELMKLNCKITYDVYTYGEISNLDIEKIDFLYVFRIYSESILALVDKAKRLGIPTLFETDDNYFALEFINGEPVHKKSENKVLSSIVKKVDKVLVYSNFMYDLCLNMNKNVELLNTYQIVKKSEIKDNSTKVRKIGFMGSLKKDLDFQVVVPAIEKLLVEYDDVLIEFFGFVPVELLNNPRVSSYDFNPDYESFIGTFTKRNWTIALAPLANTDFNKSKTNNKYREYSAARYPGVYSNIETYSLCVIDGVNGLLVDNKEESWYQGIKKLLDNDNLREEIRNNAYKDIKNNYSFVEYTVYKHDILIELAKKKIHIQNTNDASIEKLNNKSIYIIFTKIIRKIQYYRNIFKHKFSGNSIYPDMTDNLFNNRISVFTKNKEKQKNILFANYVKEYPFYDSYSLIANNYISKLEIYCDIISESSLTYEIVKDGKIHHHANIKILKNGVVELDMPELDGEFELRLQAKDYSHFISVAEWYPKNIIKRIFNNKKDLCYILK